MEPVPGLEAPEHHGGGRAHSARLDRPARRRDSGHPRLRRADAPRPRGADGVHLSGQPGLRDRGLLPDPGHPGGHGRHPCHHVRRRSRHPGGLRRHRRGRGSLEAGSRRRQIGQPPAPLRGRPGRGGRHPSRETRPAAARVRLRRHPDHARLPAQLQLLQRPGASTAPDTGSGPSPTSSRSSAPSPRSAC